MSRRRWAVSVVAMAPFKVVPLAAALVFAPVFGWINDEERPWGGRV